MSVPAGEGRGFALFADGCDLVEDVLPLRFLGEVGADIGGEVGELAIVEHRAEAGHERTGFTIARPDAVEDDVDEIIGRGIVGNGAQAEQHRSRYRQAGSAAVTGGADTGEYLGATHHGITASG